MIDDEIQENESSSQKDEPTSEELIDEEPIDDSDDFIYKNIDPSDTITLYLRQVCSYPRISAKEEKELAIRIKNHDEEAREKMICANTRLVVSIAKNYVNKSSLDFMDLVQEGNKGLMTAVAKFDHTKNFKFSTYATWWIKQAIRRAIDDLSNTIRVPVHVMEQYSKISKFRSQYIQENGEEPTNEEIMEALELTEKQFTIIMNAVLPTISLDKPLGDDNEKSTKGDLTADDKDLSPADYVNKVNSNEILSEMLTHLNEKERKVLILRKGLFGENSHTLDEIGKMLNLTRERIRQIEVKAIWKLTKLSKSQVK